MSIDYNLTNCEVSVKFNNAKEMEEKIKAFEQECHEYTDDGIYVPAYISQTDDDKKELKARVIVSESEYVEIDELKKDLDEALDYISMVVSNGDITECGVAHLFKKYYPEEYKEELKNKEDK